MSTLRWLPVWAATAMLLGCTRLVSGAAQLPPTQLPGAMLPDGVDVHQLMLDSARMRGIAGAGEEMSIVPGMDNRSPVDIDQLAVSVPPECRFVYLETAIFGHDLTQFHKTTFQYPPRGALISEAAAGYPDADAARRAFETLVTTVAGCAANPTGAVLVGDWDTDVTSLHTRSGRCGSDYLIKSAVLLEVTFCGFPASVPDLVITNLAAGLPG